MICLCCLDDILSPGLPDVFTLVLPSWPTTGSVADSSPEAIRAHRIATTTFRILDKATFDQLAANFQSLAFIPLFRTPKFVLVLGRTDFKLSWMSATEVATDNALENVLCRVPGFSPSVKPFCRVFSDVRPSSLNTSPISFY